MRGLALYARARGLPTAAGVALAGAAALWWLGQAADTPRLRFTAALLAALAATAAFGPGLAGADASLDRSASLAWPPRRAGHVVAVVGVVAVLLVAGTSVGEPLAAASAVVRAVVGFGGLLALGAVVLGSSWAWLPPVVWTLAVLLFGPAPSPLYREVLTWMTQPAGTTSATMTAGVLGAVGVVAYAALGGRR